VRKSPDLVTVKDCKGTDAGPIITLPVEAKAEP